MFFRFVQAIPVALAGLSCSHDYRTDTPRGKTIPFSAHRLQLSILLLSFPFQLQRVAAFICSRETTTGKPFASSHSTPSQDRSVTRRHLPPTFSFIPLRAFNALFVFICFACACSLFGFVAIKPALAAGLFILAMGLRLCKC